MGYEGSLNTPGYFSCISSKRASLSTLPTFVVPLSPCAARCVNYNCPSPASCSKKPTKTVSAPFNVRANLLALSIFTVQLCRALAAQSTSQLLSAASTCAFSAPTYELPASAPSKEETEQTRGNLTHRPARFARTSLLSQPIRGLTYRSQGMPRTASKFRPSTYISTRPVQRPKQTTSRTFETVFKIVLSAKRTDKGSAGIIDQPRRETSY